VHWSYSLSPSSVASSPVLASRQLTDHPLVITRSFYEVSALNLTSGNQLWRSTVLGCDVYGETPAVANDLVIILSCGEVVALNIYTGDITAQINPTTHDGTPVGALAYSAITNGVLAVSGLVNDDTGEGILLEYDILSLSDTPLHTLRFKCEIMHMYASEGMFVVLTSPNFCPFPQRLSVVDPFRGTEAWFYDNTHPSVPLSRPVVHNGVVYIAVAGSELLMLSLLDGSVLRREPGDWGTEGVGVLDRPDGGVVVVSGGYANANQIMWTTISSIG
jgi:hypothetical protein